MFQLHLCECFDKLLRQDDKGDVSAETIGPARADISAGIQISVECRYLGGSSDFGRASCCVIGLSLSPNNWLSCLYTISLDGKPVTFLLPLSQGYLPYKANDCSIFLAAETLLLPIPRQSLVVICSSLSGLEGAVLEIVQPAGVLPFLWMEVSGVVRSAEAKVVSVGDGDSVGTSQTAGAELLVCLAVELSGMSALLGVGSCGSWKFLGDCQSKMSFSSFDEICTSSVLPACADELADGLG
ncbi:hypothetical protein V6N11_056152 [Hibiscus sabdariffa]|uniref:Uncharacterized protein n=1 Tax=Hibiscus sabdariffa TaxID=183260 RepID=A0ABR2T3N7_9ROSI